MKFILSTVLIVFPAILTAAQPTAASAKPTVVLVHGAFADSSSWNGVVPILEQDGYSVVAAANPLRSVASDGAYVHALVASIRQPVVLVGYSCGGMVISNAANGLSNVKAMVFAGAR
jgi:pimeloyl-ACP methyl ester carboxylesterase